MNVGRNVNQSYTDGRSEMSTKIIVCLCYLILTLYSVRYGRVKALKDDDSEQPLTIYIDAGDEIGNVANSIASYGNKQDSMEQTMKSVQKTMEKVEQRLVDVEEALKTAANIQDIVEPYVKLLENRLIDIENKLNSSESSQKKNQALIVWLLEERVLNSRSTLSTHGTDQTINGLRGKGLTELAEVDNIISDKASLKLKDTRKNTAWPQSGVFVDCAAAKQQLDSHYNDGIYEISVPNFQPFNVYCWSNCSSCCPWTIVMHGSERGEENIYQRSWRDYKYGFGSASKDFFIGLDRLHVLTKLAPQTLLIHDYIAGKEKIFNEFSISDEQNNYVVDKVSLKETYFGLKIVSTEVGPGSPFSTDSMCAKIRGRSWWYNEACVASLGRESFSDNILMAIRPQACQVDPNNN